MSDAQNSSPLQMTLAERTEAYARGAIERGRITGQIVEKRGEIRSLEFRIEELESQALGTPVGDQLRRARDKKKILGNEIAALDAELAILDGNLDALRFLVEYAE